jgi:putative transposase
VIDFKGAHYPREVILYAVFFYVRYGVSVDHATLNRWVVRYSPFIASEAKKRKQSVAGSWRMDETYIKVKGRWTYLYRAIDKYGSTVDFMLSEHRDEVAATAFFKQAVDHNELPSKVVIDKSGANNAGLENINILIFLAGLLCFIDILKVKYLNNIVEQDHRFIKKITKPMMGFKAFHSASATLAGIETAHMIRKGQFANNQLPAHQQFMALAV